MAAKNREQQIMQENRFLKRILIVFLVALLCIAYAILRIPSTFRIHTAPDVTKAFVQKADEVPPYAVHGFARVLWETINYCEEDCSLEYEGKVNTYRNYITKACRRDLINHFKDKKDFYTYRSRALLPTENTIFSNDKVKKISSDLWFVKLEYQLKDDVASIDIRNNKMLYPLRIIRSDKPININPIGLEVDCYFGKGPVVLEFNNKE